MSKHTPGPWEHHMGNDCDRVKSKDRTLFAAVYSHKSESQQHANARLIAAAPTAYALLKKKEWTANRDYDGARVYICAECENEQHEDHTDDCALAKYFRAVEGK